MIGRSGLYKVKPELSGAYTVLGILIGFIDYKCTGGIINMHLNINQI